MIQKSTMNMNLSKTCLSPCFNYPANHRPCINPYFRTPKVMELALGTSGRTQGTNEDFLRSILRVAGFSSKAFAVLASGSWTCVCVYIYIYTYGTPPLRYLPLSGFSCSQAIITVLWLNSIKVVRTHDMQHQSRFTFNRADSS